MLETLGRRSAANAYLFLAISMLLWAGNHVIGRWAHGQFPPMTLAFLRWSGAALLIVPFALSSLRADRAVIGANVPRLLLLGFLGSGIYNALQYIALTGTTVTNAAILNSWAPVLIATAGSILFRGHLRRSQMAGLALSLTGVLAILLHGDPAGLTSFDLNHGDLVMLLGTLFWAAYTTLLRLRPAIFSTTSFAAITYSVAGLINLPRAG